MAVATMWSVHVALIGAGIAPKMEMVVVDGLDTTSIHILAFEMVKLGVNTNSAGDTMENL